MSDTSGDQNLRFHMCQHHMPRKCRHPEWVHIKKIKNRQSEQITKPADHQCVWSLPGASDVSGQWCDVKCNTSAACYMQWRWSKTRVMTRTKKRKTSQPQSIWQTSFASTGTFEIWSVDRLNMQQTKRNAVAQALAANFRERSREIEKQQTRQWRAHSQRDP